MSSWREFPISNPSESTKTYPPGDRFTDCEVYNIEFLLVSGLVTPSLTPAWRATWSRPSLRWPVMILNLRQQENISDLGSTGSLSLGTMSDGERLTDCNFHKTRFYRLVLILLSIVYIFPQEVKLCEKRSSVHF